MAAHTATKPTSVATMLMRDKFAQDVNEGAETLDPAKLKEAIADMDRDKLEEQLLSMALQGVQVSEPVVNWENPYTARGENGFGIDVTSLQFDRFRLGGVVPAHLAQSQSWCAVEAEICREGRRPFLDSDQCELELKDPKMYQQISTSIKDVDALVRQREDLERAEQIMAERRDLLSNILAEIHVWRRPHQITHKPSLFAPGNVLLSFKPQDFLSQAISDKKKLQFLKLGAELKSDKVHSLVKFKDNSIFADSYFLAAIAMVATNRTVFSNLFVSCEHLDVGMITMQFFSTLVDELNVPGWQAVTVDNLIPCDERLRPVFGNLVNENELWMVYMEKAYAKFLDSYSLLHHGDTADAMMHLTGGFCLLDEWNSSTVDEKSQATVWWKIRENARHGLFTGSANIDKVNNPTDGSLRQVIRTDADYLEWNDTAIGIVATCELPVKQVGAPDKVHKLVKMRNLYGKSDWFGSWSNGSNSWTKDLRNLAGYEADAQDDYVQWMDVEDFTKQYNTLLTTQNFPGSPLIFYRHLNAQEEGTVAFHAIQYLITVVDPTDPNFERDTGGPKNEDLTKSLEMHVTGRVNAALEDGGVDPARFEESDDDNMDDDSEDEDDETASRKVDEMMRSVEATDKDMDVSARDSRDIEADADAAADAGATERFSFSKMKQNLGAGAKKAEKAKEKEEARGPKFVVRFELSQPTRDLKDHHINPKVADPKETSIHLFHVKGRTLQPCSYIDTEYGDQLIIAEGDKTYYSFPSNNRLKMTPEAVSSKFHSKNKLPLKPGHYVLVIYQNQSEEDLQYCLRVETFDDPMFPTHYQAIVEEVGSCADPKIEVMAQEQRRGGWKPKTAKK